MLRSTFRTTTRRGGPRRPIGKRASLEPHVGVKMPRTSSLSLDAADWAYNDFQYGARAFEAFMTPSVRSITRNCFMTEIRE